MRKATPVLLVVMLILAISASPAGARAITRRVVLTNSFHYMFNAQCIDEPLQVRGTVTSILRTTATPTSRLLSGGHTHADMTATGLVTGDIYRIVDIREITTNLQGAGSQDIGAWAYLIVGPGPNNNLLVTNQYHLTVTPAGKVTADFYRVTIKCVG